VRLRFFLSVFSPVRVRWIEDLSPNFALKPQRSEYNEMVHCTSKQNNNDDKIAAKSNFDAHTGSHMSVRQECKLGDASVFTVV
jgi:hypothetical protein